MITIPRSRLQIWPGFCLDISDDIHFHCPGSYYLKGNNGSGKSSFINRVLLPAIKDRNDLHLIVLQQQMHMQLYAMRAWAAMHYPERRVADESDVWDLLSYDLASLKDDKALVVIADEARNLIIPEGLKRPVCLIYSSHDQKYESHHILEFRPTSAYESELTSAGDKPCAD